MVLSRIKHSIPSYNLTITMRGRINNNVPVCDILLPETVTGPSGRGWLASGFLSAVTNNIVWADSRHATHTGPQSRSGQGKVPIKIEDWLPKLSWITDNHKEFFFLNMVSRLKNRLRPGVCDFSLIKRIQSRDKSHWNESLQLFLKMTLTQVWGHK